MSKSCSTCRWVIATVLDATKGGYLHPTYVCLPCGQEPSQIALGVCECWMRESGADSYGDVYDSVDSDYDLEV